MFNRAMKCLSFVQKPLIFKPITKKCTPSLLPSFVCPTNLHYSGCNLTLVEKRFYSTAPESSETNDEQIPIEGSNHKSLAANELQAMRDSDPVMDKRYKVLQLEVDIMRQAGKMVPNEIKPSEWIRLLKEPTRSSRRRHLMYLFKLEKTRENEKKKKVVARIEREKMRETQIVDENEYRLHKVSMFLRIYDVKMNQFYHSRLIQSMMFGEKLIIDCGYDTHMTTREQTECAKQLSFMFAQNRTHRDPFDLHFCNVNKSSILMDKFRNIIPPAFNGDFPLNISERSYTEIFDKSKLVYLTPHCNNEMKEYDFDSIYIIGALVDKTTSEPVSLAKAKKEGLRMAKLPVDKYLLWGSGASKRFPLNHMISILLDVKATKDWNKAFEHVPRRKLEDRCKSEPESYPISRMILQQKNYPSKKTVSQTRDNFNFEERSKRRFSK